MYSSRQAKILSICLLRDGYITYQEISEKLQISSRTIMRELQIVKNSLQKKNLIIHSKKGKGICILGTDEDKQNFIIEIQESKIGYMDKEERQKLLCLEILKKNEIEKLFYYSDKFCVSEATISHDLDDLEAVFNKFDIKLIRRPGYGIGIQGSEVAIRQAISTIVNNTIQQHIMNADFNRYNIEDVINQITVTHNSNMKELLDYHILKKILEIFKLHRDELNFDEIAKSSYIGLLIHLMIAIYRVQAGEQLVENQGIYNLIEDEQSMRKASLIVHYLEEAFDIEMGKTECVFVAVHLQSAKPAIVDRETSVEEYNDIIMKMLSIFQDAGYQLLGDYELYQSLAAHLKPALVRLEYKLPIYNPMLDQIKERFKDVFDLTKQTSQVFYEIYGFELNDDEAGYLALHFAAAIERSKISHLRSIEVGIICSSGIGVSALLMAKLKNVVDSNVYLTPLSITDINNNSCELLVSTFNIEGAILVTPMLNQSDIVRVLQAIEIQRKNPPKKVEKKTIDYDLISLIDLIKQLVDHINLYYVSNSLSKIQLIQTVCSTVTADPSLVHDILEREEKGSNVYKTFGFALLHVSTSLVDNALIHIFKPDKNEFIGEKIEGIKVVLLMLIPKNASSIEKRMMSFISSQLIENATFFQKLVEADVDEIKKEFNNILQKWVIMVINEVKNDEY